MSSEIQIEVPEEEQIISQSEEEVSENTKSDLEDYLINRNENSQKTDSENELVSPSEAAQLQLESLCNEDLQLKKITSCEVVIGSDGTIKEMYVDGVRSTVDGLDDPANPFRMFLENGMQLYADSKSAAIVESRSQDINGERISFSLIQFETKNNTREDLDLEHPSEEELSNNHPHQAETIENKTDQVEISWMDRLFDQQSTQERSVDFLPMTHEVPSQLEAVREMATLFPPIVTVASPQQVEAKPTSSIFQEIVSAPVGTEVVIPGAPASQTETNHSSGVVIDALVIRREPQGMTLSFVEAVPQTPQHVPTENSLSPAPVTAPVTRMEVHSHSETSPDSPGVPVPQHVGMSREQATQMIDDLPAAPHHASTAPIPTTPTKAPAFEVAASSVLNEPNTPEQPPAPSVLVPDTPSSPSVIVIDQPPTAPIVHDEHRDTRDGDIGSPIEPTPLVKVAALPHQILEQPSVPALTSVAEATTIPHQSLEQPPPSVIISTTEAVHHTEQVTPVATRIPSPNTVLRLNVTEKTPETITTEPEVADHVSVPIQESVAAATVENTVKLNNETADVSVEAAPAAPRELVTVEQASEKVLPLIEEQPNVVREPGVVVKDVGSTTTVVEQPAYLLAPLITAEEKPRHVIRLSVNEATDTGEVLESPPPITRTERIAERTARNTGANAPSSSASRSTTIAANQVATTNAA